MDYQLIPLPISILFTLVFVVAVLFLLWKIRRKAKIYNILFYLCIAIALFLLAGIIYSLATEPKLLLNVQQVEAVFL